MKGALLRILVCGLLFLACACSRPTEPPVADAQGKPALWKVSSETGSAWLFGTIHQLPPDTDWQSPELDQAIRTSDVLVLEAAGLEDQQAIARLFAQLGRDDDQPPLINRISPSLRERFARAGSAHAALDDLESWAAALTLASVQSSGLGLRPGHGVERILTMRFRADEKPMIGLETIAEQFGFFDTLSEADQRLMLNAVVRESGDQRTRFETMLAAWMRGDADTVLGNQADGLLASPAIREAILDGRNRRWAEKIGRLVRSGDTAFVAVGAGHMAGKGGVPALLQQRGFTVVRVQ